MVFSILQSQGQLQHVADFHAIAWESEGLVALTLRILKFFPELKPKILPLTLNGHKQVVGKSLKWLHDVMQNYSINIKEWIGYLGFEFI